MSDSNPNSGRAAVAAANFTKPQRVDDKTYVVDLAPAFNIAAVPNGGYVAGQFIAVALAHVAKYGHKHVISAHWDFLDRSKPGRGTMVVDEMKIARNMSVLYISLYQDGQLAEAPWVSPGARRIIVGSITCRDMATETGTTLDGGFKTEYPPQNADLELLPLGKDPNWELFTVKNFRPNKNWHMYEQKQISLPTGLRDMWVEYASGDRIKNVDLTYLADVTPAICTFGLQTARVDDISATKGLSFWYPTLNIHMDFKKSLPAEGSRWLRLRTTVKETKNGRYGCDVDIFDREGDLVAQARHVAMIVDVSRNTAGRKASKPANL
ncbi:hypothetical protein NLG97_g3615 [Lecanicillium saksenae]|uniref:Uncharacterized protein n=1 Tax=Lecanicillium saksenae TaxID=468837 RepID=A0ACC1QXR5_9HYPO|nr:hypothetical protein NLG97_g3615 [Lecanicillium saksenae]